MLTFERLQPPIVVLRLRMLRLSHRARTSFQCSHDAPPESSASQTDNSHSIYRSEDFNLLQPLKSYAQQMFLDHMCTSATATDTSEVTSATATAERVVPQIAKKLAQGGHAAEARRRNLTGFAPACEVGMGALEARPSPLEISEISSWY